MTHPVSDSAHGTDAVVPRATTPVAETGTGTDAISWTGLVILTDGASGRTGFGTGPFGGGPFGVSGVDRDNLAVTATAPLGDAGSGSDGLSWRRYYQPNDEAEADLANVAGTAVLGYWVATATVHTDD